MLYMWQAEGVFVPCQQLPQCTAGTSTLRSTAFSAAKAGLHISNVQTKTRCRERSGKNGQFCKFADIGTLEKGDAAPSTGSLSMLQKDLWLLHKLLSAALNDTKHTETSKHYDHHNNPHQLHHLHTSNSTLHNARHDHLLTFHRCLRGHKLTWLCRRCPQQSLLCRSPGQCTR